MGIKVNQAVTLREGTAAQPNYNTQYSDSVVRCSDSSLVAGTLKVNGHEVSLSVRKAVMTMGAR